MTTPHVVTETAELQATDIDSIVVTMVHARRAGMCARGCMRFASEHNLDWKAFISCGLPARDLLATGDLMAIQVVEEALKWAEAKVRLPDTNIA